MKQILDGIWNAQPSQIITWLAIAVGILAVIYCLLAFLIFRWMK
ncbi:MAG: hypothetical protein ACFWTW_08140 [Lentilactobacillus parabuchneri]|jgi:hypothetical protein|nr:hypothetical protein FAM21809_02184 [Lentilactobacillus parabuchneri]ORN13630.1 hypothetical protein FAM23164_02155 [Lentilactobacillus parabuchneri]ORN15400.1 hypothetical protein FAM23165_02195 [Lentilactobacillus parabuchneri]ORN18365.1 hypothetical protein FAM23166_02197 [Lentilactobacillus parabuchneri]ORN23887.1 hypothetical protein FAM23167_02176 [Lentilactobacillus parabuchneri]